LPRIGDETMSRKAGARFSGKNVRQHQNSEPMRRWAKSERALEHGPEKHALGLTPLVETGFPKRTCDNKEI
jgi:hypothetical protein